MADIDTEEEPTEERPELSEENEVEDNSDTSSVAENTADSHQLDSSLSTWEDIEFHLERKYGSKKTIKLEPTEEDTSLLIDFISRAEFEEDETAAQVWLAKFVKFNDSHPTLKRKRS